MTKLKIQDTRQNNIFIKRNIYNELSKNNNLNLHKLDIFILNIKKLLKY